MIYLVDNSKHLLSCKWKFNNFFIHYQMRRNHFSGVDFFFVVSNQSIFKKVEMSTKKNWFLILVFGFSFRHKSCQILTRYIITTVTRSFEMIQHLYKYFWVFNSNFEPKFWNQFIVYTIFLYIGVSFLEYFPNLFSKPVHKIVKVYKFWMLWPQKLNKEILSLCYQLIQM